MTAIVVSGAAGRMGGAILRAAVEAGGLTLAAAVERADHPAVGTDAEGFPGVAIAGALLDVPGDASGVLIEFTSPEATCAHLEIWARRPGSAAVVGTTGLEAEHRSSIERLAGDMPIVLAPNMSTGVNLLFGLAAQAARVLGNDFDVEIVEAHHRKKKDAPSGTAVRLLEVVAEALDRDPDADSVHGRQGMVGERTDREIGVHAVRGGDIVGEHRVLFAAAGEVIEITHRASDRAIFARGAVRAAAWVDGKPPGLYGMSDVLGL